jgi:hypothetical protein
MKDYKNIPFQSFVFVNFALFCFSALMCSCGVQIIREIEKNEVLNIKNPKIKELVLGNENLIIFDEKGGRIEHIFSDSKEDIIIWGSDIMGKKFNINMEEVKIIQIQEDHNSQYFWLILPIGFIVALLLPLLFGKQ